MVDHTTCFIRLQRRHWHPQSISSFDNSLKASVLLRQNTGLSQVVAPYSTKHGEVSCRISGWTVAVFPFVRGTSLYKLKPSFGNVAKSARLLARIHKSNTEVGFPKLWKEEFNNPFRANILRILADSEEPRTGNGKDAYRQGLLHLLDNHRETIVHALDIMARLKLEILKTPPKLVLTHGDANMANFIKNKHGRVYLIDWGDAGLGPAERDVFHFSGKSLGPFLKHYRRVRRTVKFSKSVFAFYYYRWALQEISDFSTRILFMKSGLLKKRHAWKELQPYVPVPNDSISRDLARIESVISG